MSNKLQISIIFMIAIMLSILIVPILGCNETVPLPINENTTFTGASKGCIEGHVYYSVGGAHGGIAIHLDDDGKPVKCGKNK